MPTVPSLRLPTLPPRITARLPSIRLGRLSGLAIVAGALLFALLAGFLVMTKGWFGGVYALALIVGMWLLALVAAGKDEHYDWVFLVLLAGIFVIPLVYKVTYFPLNAPYQLFILAVGLGCIGALLRQARGSRVLTASLAAFALFLAIGVGTSVVGRSSVPGAVFQFFSDLKPMFLVAIGYRLAWSPWVEKVFWTVVRWYWVVALVFIALEWAAPGLHMAILPGGQLTQDASGLLPSRAMGTFEHPSFLANLTVLLALVCLARWRETKPMGWGYFWLALVYLAILLCTSSRGELAGFLIAFSIGLIVLSSRLTWPRVIAGGLLVSLAVIGFWWIFADTILKEAAAWGVGTVGAVSQPRAQILFGAFSVANRYFPFGSGLGTYGGAGAEKFDLSLYYELGFGNYWWFMKEDYLMDTYWPNSLAETGYLGALLLLVSYILLAVHAFVRARQSHSPRARSYWALACCGMWYLLFNSGSSPTFQDPRLFLLVAVMFGIGARLDARHAAELKRA
ncbi:MAG: hypothetical protein EPO12_09255 [Aquabacterium sp.]|nr:MAG: hypothetical protein EPO12_09255 [Aquabacterium sp.]